MEGMYCKLEWEMGVAGPSINCSSGVLNSISKDITPTAYEIASVKVRPATSMATEQ